MIMCGIVGYVGDQNAQAVLLDGLARLEYRGYDSAGITLFSDGALRTVKAKGPLKALRERLTQEYAGTTGIGHTRWATHGAPSDHNAHPHMDNAGEIALVHNGIIENHQEIREELMAEGCVFHSETDTEVIVHLLRKVYQGNMGEALRKVVARLRGSWALGVVSSLDPDRLYATRKDSPLVVGVGKGENLIASDVTALISHTRDVIYLDDGDIAVITKGAVDITDRDGNKVDRSVEYVAWDVQAAEKAGYDHFMIKEIHEQPRALRDTLSPRLVGNGIQLGVEGLEDAHLRSIKRVVIVACGTAYHAGYAAKYAIESLARVPVEVDIASEYRYKNPIIYPDDLFMVVSQSGETADTLAALRIAQERGAKVLAITNVVGSSVAREADAVFYTWAGPEIAVASTKAYLTQLMALFLITLELARVRGTMSAEQIQTHLTALKKTPECAQSIIDQETHVKDIAGVLHKHHDVFYMGRGSDYATAMEGSLKIKEVSYIHTEALAAGELKHGTIALIDEGTPVIAFVTQNELREKMASNLREVIARGAQIYSIQLDDDEQTKSLSVDAICVPEMPAAFSPILAVIPAQLIGYYCAILRGLDPDKPRNLAKSVTVE
jgi:glucosamine--fructose-6-phosphate aminotransferase (isomerizing)